MAIKLKLGDTLKQHKFSSYKDHKINIVVFVRGKKKSQLQHFLIIIFQNILLEYKTTWE